MRRWSRALGLGPDPATPPSDDGGRAGDSPWRPFVDDDYYRAQHPAVADPLAHFREVGHAEGRVPHPGLEPLAGALALRARTSLTPLGDLLDLLPRGTRRHLMRPKLWDALRLWVHPAFYAAQREGDVDPLSPEETLDHYLGEGIFAGLRPSLLFHPQFYADLVARETREPIPDGTDPFLHWLILGRHELWVPTPLYDEDYYAARSPEVARTRRWAFAHYVEHGAFERGRRPSTWVQPTSALQHPRAKVEHWPFLLPQLIDGATPEQLRSTSPLEERVIEVRRKADRLADPVIEEMVARAYAIEPLVRRPYGPREINWPPRLNSAVVLRDAVEAARRRIGLTSVDTLVLVPHCRMAGSARVTGALVSAVEDLAPDQTVLVVTTDLATFERPDWFPDGVHVADVSELAGDLVEEYRTRLLLDVVRGLQPQRVINVNSRRGWELYRMFGRQLRTMTELHAYLFTWDLDREGNKGGYPITYFQECLPDLAGVMIDSTALRDELVWRYVLTGPPAERLRVLHTPASTPEEVDHSALFERRRAAGGPLRAFWSGRFDRQKRFDVVVGLAELMPELEIWAWGKAVIGDADVDLEALPPNVRLQGTYQHFEELPVADCDFFLYTSEWDGLPTILIDAGARGIPTVASQVGGVGDVLTPDTGYPVVDALDASAYAAAVAEMLADPAEVSRRAARLRARVRERCATDRYTRDVAAALGMDPAGAAR